MYIESKCCKLAGIIATIIAAISLSLSALAQEQEMTGEPALDEAQTVSEEQTEDIAPPVAEVNQEGPPAPEQLELISLDDLPTTESEEFDEEFEVLQPPPSQQESNIEELRRNFELYKVAIDNASYDEADILAKRMVELTIRLYGLDSHESAKALTNLGRVQHKNKDHDSAILNFTASIQIIEKIEDRLNSELINPLRGLGAAHLGNGRPDLAREAYDRAVHVSHVNEGPHNLMQIQVLEELAETYLTAGETKEALDIHQFIYNLESRNMDLRSEDMIPALQRQAAWTHRMRMHERERMTWRKIIGILEKSRGKEDLSLIPPLTGLGISYLYISDFELEAFGSGGISSGDTYLKRAVRISSKNPEATWETQVQTMLALADYYTVSSRATKAVRVYKETWKILSTDDERIATRVEVLETPHRLQNIHPPKYYRPVRSEAHSKKPAEEPEEYSSGKIVLSYSISSRGNTRNIEILEVDPPGLENLEYSVAREMRRLIHRPRMVDGLPVETPGQTLTHEFFYDPADVPKTKDEQANESVAAEES